MKKHHHHHQIRKHAKNELQINQPFYLDTYI